MSVSNPFLPLATAPSSLTITQQLTVSGIITVTSQPGGNAIRLPIGPIEFVPGQVVTDATQIAALVICGVH
jgi:hypothetical protein